METNSTIVELFNDIHEVGTVKQCQVKAQDKEQQPCSCLCKVANGFYGLPNTLYKSRNEAPYEGYSHCRVRRRLST